MPTIPYNLLYSSTVEDAVYFFGYRGSTADKDLRYYQDTRVLADYILEHFPDIPTGFTESGYSRLPDIPSNADMQAVKMWCVWDVLRVAASHVLWDIQPLRTAVAAYLENPTEANKVAALVAGNEHTYRINSTVGIPATYVAFTAGFEPRVACTIAYPNVAHPQYSDIRIDGHCRFEPYHMASALQMPRIKLLYLLREHLPATYPIPETGKTQ